MKIILSGASGFIGQSLAAHLAAQNHEIVRLVREKTSAPGTAFWDPATDTLDPALIASSDAVINLCGANISEGRWTPARKSLLRSSRLQPTQLLAKTLAAIPPRATGQRVFINASAIGYYGDRGESVLDEGAASGKNFLAELCREWETATIPAATTHTRVIKLRIGLVLDPTGGTLKKLAPIFRLGLGGPIADGRAWLSWISLPDLCAAITHTLKHTALRGAVNAVAPHPARSAEFTRAFANALNRPAFLRTPAFALRWIFGQMAQETVLSSTRVLPRELEGSGFVFQQAQIEPALRQLFAKR